ncbi:MAG: endonuclease domain-containing protein [Mediterranea sp.]|jgi:very-short-patch-repair endonuclease|nr:endonuclease domain-containing protein [Mediterranea sp.]
MKKDELMDRTETTYCRKKLRRNGTSAEAVLWTLIKAKQVDGLRFRRQHGVGPYILDFYCPELHLAIELDGEVHVGTEEHDESRTLYLTQKAGIRVLRFENRVVFDNFQGIVDAIREVAKMKRG